MLQEQNDVRHGGEHLELGRERRHFVIGELSEAVQNTTEREYARGTGLAVSLTLLPRFSSFLSAARPAEARKARQSLVDHSSTHNIMASNVNAKFKEFTAMTYESA